MLEKRLYSKNVITEFTLLLIKLNGTIIGKIIGATAARGMPMKIGVKK